MTDNTDGVAKVAELAKDMRFAMLTTVDAQGEFISRPMATQEVEFDGDLWFFAHRDSRKVAHISTNPHVNVTLTTTDKWLSISGSAQLVTDVVKAKELWNAGIEAWMPQGPEDPSVVLIKINGDSAEYWDNPGGRVSTALSFAKSKLTGKPYDGGENERVEL